MAKVFGMWYGGSNYAAPEINDAEEFGSIKEAKETFQDRYDNADRSTPCVGDNCEMHLFFYDPRESNDPYPDRILKYGPRGGVVAERA